MPEQNDLGVGPIVVDDTLTERQREVFDFIISFTIEHFYQPSFRDIAEHFGFSGITGCLSHLEALHKKGFIGPLKQGTRARCLEILRRPKLIVVAEDTDA